MTNDALRAQLFAIRAQVDALLLQTEPVTVDAPEERTPDAEGVCPHPVGQRRDLSTMGGPAGWLCKLCGHEQFDEEA